jgi:hypothetical protein
MTTQLRVKLDFVHSEIGSRADFRMDKVELSLCEKMLVLTCGLRARPARSFLSTSAPYRIAAR